MIPKTYYFFPRGKFCNHLFLLFIPFHFIISFKIKDLESNISDKQFISD